MKKNLKAIFVMAAIFVLFATGQAKGQNYENCVGQALGAKKGACTCASTQLGWVWVAADNVSACNPNAAPAQSVVEPTATATPLPPVAAPAVVAPTATPTTAPVQVVPNNRGAGVVVTAAPALPNATFTISDRDVAALGPTGLMIAGALIVALLWKPFLWLLGFLLQLLNWKSLLVIAGAVLIVAGGPVTWSWAVAIGILSLFLAFVFRVEKNRMDKSK